jgi:hypothetical protein
MTPQHLEALDRANEIRIARAHLKADIRAGEMTVPEALNDQREMVATMKVADLLKAQERWGDKRTNRLLRFLDISQNKLCGTLTDRQRDLICLHFRGEF